MRMTDALFRPPWIIRTVVASAVRWMKWDSSHDGPDEEEEEGCHAEAACEETTPPTVVISYGCGRVRCTGAVSGMRKAGLLLSGVARSGNTLSVDCHWI